MASTPARIQANIENSRKSTGPRSPAGKKRASLNALRHGLASNVALLPTEDAAVYTTFIASFHADLSPSGPLETQLTQTIADLQWSLNRFRAHEANLFALGHEQNAPDFEDYEESIQTALAGAQTLRLNTDSLKTLSIYEQRLDRRFRSALKDLREAQSLRKAQEQIDLAQALPILAAKIQKGLPFDPAEFGFVCSSDQISLYARRVSAVNQAREALKSAGNKFASGTSGLREVI